MSAKIGKSLDSFKLFYEEIANDKPIQTRIRRIRQTGAING